MVGRSDLQVKINGALYHTVAESLAYFSILLERGLSSVQCSVVGEKTVSCSPTGCVIGAGVRVDLSEVEACLESIPDVAEAAAKAWPGLNGAGDSTHRHTALLFVLRNIACAVIVVPACLLSTLAH